MWTLFVSRKLFGISSFTCYGVFCQTISKTRDSFANWNHGKLSHIIFSSATFNSEIVLGFGWRFQSSFMRRSPNINIICMAFKFGELMGGHCSFQSLAGHVLLRQCWERRAICAEPRCMLMNLPLRLSAVGCTIQGTSEAEINKPLQLLFATTVPLKLHHRDVIVVQSWHY